MQSTLDELKRLLAELLDEQKAIEEEQKKLEADKAEEQPKTAKKSCSCC